MSKLKLSSNASGSGNVTLQSPNTNSDFTVTVPTGTGTLPLMRLETAQTASGTAVDFTGIPSWVKRITVMFNGVSTNGASNPIIQIGSGSVTTSEYLSGAVNLPNAGTPQGSNSNIGLIVTGATASGSVLHGVITIISLGSNVWVSSGAGGRSDSAAAWASGGSITLAGTLDRVRITTVNGTDTFDAGTINILYEG